MSGWQGVPSRSEPREQAPSNMPSAEHVSEAFHALLGEIGTLHDRKQADYGKGDDPFANIRSSEEWGIPAWVGAMVRANDKVHRLKRFAERGSLANESVEDSLMDIAVYALIALVLYREESASVEANAVPARVAGTRDASATCVLCHQYMSLHGPSGECPAVPRPCPECYAHGGMHTRSCRYFR